MFNNRMLAVAAVLVMAVPALGAATPIVVPPVPEQLVEGHTVFTVIEIVAATQTNEVRFAAAVAVLVREYQARNVAQRFPGVLWFNDQYLTNPYQDENDFARFRYPCGGAVMAVNAGDPDPRMVIARIGDHAAPPWGYGADGDVTVGDAEQTYTNPPWQKPYPGTYSYGNDYAWVGVDPASGDVWSDSVVGTADGQGIVPTVAGIAGFGGPSGPYDYRESYLITDPNDHSWIIDVYDFYTRYGVIAGAPVTGDEVFGPSANDGSANRHPGAPATGTIGGSGQTAEYGTTGPTYTWPVWVVNVLGSPVFIPDYGTTVLAAGDGYIGESCVPFKDLIEEVLAPIDGALCGVNVPNLVSNGEGADNEITVNPYNGVPPWTDDPCMGYQEPSRNGFCYGGQTDVGTGCPHGTPGNDRKHSKYGVPNEPYRQYNALLYFHLEDLRVWDGTTKDHCNYDPALEVSPGVFGGCNPALSRDTNGCSEEQYPWGPNPPQAANDWPCPDDSTDGTVECESQQGLSDDCEGNSHPFHPLAPPHEEAEPCLPQYSTADPNGTDARRRNPANHGGSTYVNDPTTPWYTNPRDGNEWYQVYAPCDYGHTTRNIDIYFSPAGRPFPPLVRAFSVIDLEGSSAPFQDFHSSYPGVP